MTHPRVLILAEHCNPEWPSLPVVGYNYAVALAAEVDATVVTHVRNRQNIEKAGALEGKVVYIDNEWLAAPMYRLATWLRGGSEVAWSTSQIMAYLPYLAFERQALTRMRGPLGRGELDIVHRITPMTPTLPSYIAGRTRQPFVLGPLNGGLDWPAAFRSEQRREREMLRKLRGAARFLPYARSTYWKSACVLAAFPHTILSIRDADPSKVVPFPEIGFDPRIFHASGRTAPLSGEGPKRFLFGGRLVPYKVPEVAIRAFAQSPLLKDHILHVVGDGPELPRLRRMVAEHGATERVLFEGRQTQTQLADFMRRCDVFVFPSIRELGAGVVIEAMASGMVCLVTDYGAPGALAAEGRGLRVDLQPLEGLVQDYRMKMETCLAQPKTCAAMAERAREYARQRYTWASKAAYTIRIYEAILKGQSLTGFDGYSG